MADAAWSPDDSTFRSTYCPLMSGRWLPGVKGIYALPPGFVPWILSAACRSRRLDLPSLPGYLGGDFRSLLNLWASISQPRLRYTLGSAATGGERYCTLPPSRKGTVPASLPGAQ